MAIQKVLQFGNPLLREVAADVLDFHSAQTLQVLTDLQDTLQDLQRIHQMGGGLAAPQIGSSIRAVYVNARGRSFFLLNPEIVDAGEEMFDVWDFCFSSKAAFLARIERHRNITVEYQNEDGDRRKEEFEGYFSELLQHEIDHLYGRLFIDRITRPETITMVEEWDRTNATD